MVPAIFGWGERMRRTATRRRAGPFAGVVFAVLLLALGAPAAPGLLEGMWERVWSRVAPAETVAARFTLCAGPARVTCVVDGDTIWLDGVKIRIADMNTPETGQPQCAAEAALGRRATERLVELLNAGPFELRPAGARDEDPYGRKLRLVVRDGRSLGEVMVAEGLAHRWEGFRADWC